MHRTSLCVSILLPDNDRCSIYYPLNSDYKEEKVDVFINLAERVNPLGWAYCSIMIYLRFLNVILKGFIKMIFLNDLKNITPNHLGHHFHINNTNNEVSNLCPCVYLCVFSLWLPIPHFSLAFLLWLQSNN